MDKDYKTIITETEEKSDRLCEEARQAARDAEKNAQSEASRIKETGIRKAKDKADKILFEAQEKAGRMLSDSETLWTEDENRIKKATWASSEEAARTIVGKVINL